MRRFLKANKLWLALALGLVLVMAVSAWAVTTLTASLKVQLSSRFTTSLGLSTPVEALSLDLSQSFVSGTSNKQVTVIFADKRTLADAGTENLDLAGTLTNSYGQTVTFTKVKAMVFKNTSTTQTLTIGGAASNQFINWVGAGTHTVNIPPEGVFVLSAPNAGFAVTAGTGDLLKVLNSAGAAVDYKVWIIGN